MKKILFVIAILAISVPAFANLLVNGDFEDGDLTGWTAWTAPRGSYVAEVQYDVAFDGAALHLTGSESSFGVYQSFDTIPGQPYTISGVWMVPNGNLHWAEVMLFNDDGRDPYDQMDAPLDSSILLKVDGWGMNGQTFSSWENFDAGNRWYSGGPFSTTVIATGTKMYVNLKAGTAVGNGVHAYFDNVSVTTVPEPCTMLALAAGLGALVVRRRK